MEGWVQRGEDGLQAWPRGWRCRETSSLSQNNRNMPNNNSKVALFTWDFFLAALLTLATPASSGLLEVFGKLMEILISQKVLINVHALCSNDQVQHKLASIRIWCDMCYDTWVGYDSILRYCVQGDILFLRPVFFVHTPAVCAYFLFQLFRWSGRDKWNEDR